MQRLIDKLAFIYLVDQRILSTRSQGKDTYYIPGGKREQGETDHEALIREIKEELSVDLLPESLKFFCQFEAQAHGQASGIVVRMTCYTGQFVGTLRAAAEIEEIVWLQYNDRVKTSPVDHLIFDFLKEQGLLM